ncbi:hypothetical protein INT48_004259 [Thamnidium elegans]|uniref:Uncharacterized protein n=1 Tax=Thamnidium elegans TaxID=101142 RepID=A0A8H7VPN2_9FUNG|nr:hypothetical protein INT48_004259 [Thamnidium elegans]
MVYFKFEECSSRIEELEKVLIETEMFLQTFTNEYQKMHTAILNSPHRVYTLETDVELARSDIKITDNYISDLSKEHSKLKAETSSLYKDIDSLKAIKLSMEEKNAEEKTKIAKRNFVTINKLKEENAKLRKYAEA